PEAKGHGERRGCGAPRPHPTRNVTPHDRSMEPAGMTALSLPRPRLPRRLRPIGLLVASVAIAAGGQLATSFRGPQALSQPAAAPGAPVGVAPDGPPPAVQGPVSAPGAPFADAPGSIEQIDR